MTALQWAVIALIVHVWFAQLGLTSRSPLVWSFQTPHSCFSAQKILLLVLGIHFTDLARICRGLSSLRSFFGLALVGVGAIVLWKFFSQISSHFIQAFKFTFVGKTDDSFRLRLSSSWFMAVPCLSALVLALVFWNCNLFAVFSVRTIVAFGVDEDLFSSSIDVIVASIHLTLRSVVLWATVGFVSVLMLSFMFVEKPRHVLQCISVCALSLLWPLVFSLPLLFVPVGRAIQLTVDPESFVTGDPETVATLNTVIGFGLSGVALLFCAVFVASCFHGVSFGVVVGSAISARQLKSRRLFVRLSGLLALVFPLAVIVKAVAITQMLDQGYLFFAAWVCAFMVTGFVALKFHQQSSVAVIVCALVCLALSTCFMVYLLVVVYGWLAAGMAFGFCMHMFFCSCALVQFAINRIKTDPDVELAHAAAVNPIDSDTQTTDRSDNAEYLNLLADNEPSRVSRCSSCCSSCSPACRSSCRSLCHACCSCWICDSDPAFSGDRLPHRRIFLFAGVIGQVALLINEGFELGTPLPDQIARFIAEKFNYTVEFSSSSDAVMATLFWNMKVLQICSFSLKTVATLCFFIMMILDVAPKLLGSEPPKIRRHLEWSRWLGFVSAVFVAAAVFLPLMPHFLSFVTLEKICPDCGPIFTNAIRGGFKAAFADVLTVKICVDLLPILFSVMPAMLRGIQPLLSHVEDRSSIRALQMFAVEALLLPFPLLLFPFVGIVQLVGFFDVWAGLFMVAFLFLPSIPWICSFLFTRDGKVPFLMYFLSLILYYLTFLGLLLYFLGHFEKLQVVGNILSDWTFYMAVFAETGLTFTVIGDALILIQRESNKREVE